MTEVIEHLESFGELIRRMGGDDYGFWEVDTCIQKWLRELRNGCEE